MRLRVEAPTMLAFLVIESAPSNGIEQPPRTVTASAATRRATTASLIEFRRKILASDTTGFEGAVQLVSAIP